MKPSRLPLLLAIYCLLPTAYCLAQDSISTTNVSTVKIRGRTSAPSLSSAGNAVFYFDKASGKLKVSENGGAFATVASGGTVAGSGTTGKLSKWTASGTLGSSLISDSLGVVIVDSGNIQLGGASTPTALTVDDSANGVSIVGDLHVGGAIYTTSNVEVVDSGGGVLLFAGGGNAASFENNLTVKGLLKAGSGPTTLTGATGLLLATAAATPTGSGNWVLGTSPTFTTSIILSSVAFAALGTPANGSLVFCSDCTKATPCASGGTGALAKRLNGAWDCN